MGVLDKVAEAIGNLMVQKAKRPTPDQIDNYYRTMWNRGDAPKDTNARLAEILANSK